MIAFDYYENEADQARMEDSIERRARFTPRNTDREEIKELAIWTFDRMETDGGPELVTVLTECPWDAPVSIVHRGWCLRRMGLER